MKNEILVANGEYVIDTITECDTLTFNHPLKIKWSAWKSLEDDDYGNIRVFVDYDFGLTDEFSPYVSVGSGWSYDGITKDSPLEDIVKSFVKYDLFHAFCHTSIDPNYSHLHWALYGNLKDRTMVIEIEPTFRTKEEG